MWQVVAFTLVLASIELLQGTPTYFVFGVVLYIVFSALAFNVAGGMNRPSGTYIAFNTILTLILGLVLKAFYGEPADANLRAPQSSIIAYVGAAAGLLVAAFLAKTFRRKRGFLEPLLGAGNSLAPALGCFIVGVGLPFTYELFGGGFGSIGSALQQLNKFQLLSIILATYHAIRSSNGKRSVNVVVLAAGAYSIFFGGLLAYSKAGLFYPFAAWLITAAAMRFNFKRSQIAVVAVMLGLIIYYLVPYAQGGRVTREDEGSAYDKMVMNLGRLDEFRNAEEEFAATEKNSPHFFKESGTLTDRLNMIAMDDALVEVTEKEGPMGFYPIESAFLNLIPHVFWPEKPFWVWGNVYAHRIGMLADEDNTTGVSFSAVGEAFITGKWVGIFVLLPAVWTALFIISDSVTGRNDRSPWGLYFTAIFATAAPEGMVNAAINVMTQLTLILIFIAYVSVYVMPLIGRLLVPTVNVVSRPLEVGPTPGSSIRRKLGEA